MFKALKNALSLFFQKQHILLFLALFLLVAGLGLVLATSGYISWGSAISGMAAVIVGIVLNMLTFWRKGRTGWFFVGFMLVFCGIFYLIVSIGGAGMNFYRLWPFFMVFSGFSLLPVGYFRNRRMKMSFFVPSMCIVFLGGFFLLFSLRVVTLSLRVFVTRLWPIIFLAAGAILLVFYISNLIRFPHPPKGADSIDSDKPREE
jgi:hypothetical protein